jgi:hypothetical protein
MRQHVYMRLTRSAVLLLCASAALAQTTGSITGIIRDVDHAPVASAPVQVTNKATGQIVKATSAASGAYTLSSLPPGSYDLSITALGFNAYTQSNLTLTAGQTHHLDIELVDYQFGTLGDGREFRIDQLSSHKTPTGKTPRTAKGKPDLSGVWYAQRPIDAGTPEPLPWAAALLRERAENNGKDAPGARCMPRGITNAGALFPWRIVQTPALLVMIFEDDIPSHRQVFLDGRAHPKNIDPKWMGHSIGHWEGDTLVVDTVGFDDRSWLTAQGHPHTEKMHVIERFRRPDLGHLEIEFTIDDPDTYSKPWIIKRAADLDTKDDVGEYVCTENNKDPEHMVGK